jgi:nuclear transport factor 2 (NTF2) superfamily protein
MSKHDLSMLPLPADNDLCIMTTEKRFPLPPWDMETAPEKLRLLENDWNTLNPEKVVANYSENAEVRFGTAFLNGSEEIKQFLIRKWQQNLGFKIKLDLWGALKGRMAVRFEYEWQNAAGQSYRSYGVQVFQFDDDGYIQMHFSSFNDDPIAKTDRRL